MHRLMSGKIISIISWKRWKFPGTRPPPMFWLFMVGLRTVLVPVGVSFSGCITMNVPVQFSSVTQLCAALFNPMDYSTAGFPVHHRLLQLAETHVHPVIDPIQTSHPLSFPSPAFYLSQHPGLFQWVSSSNQVAKLLELQLQHQSFQQIFRIDFL